MAKQQSSFYSPSLDFQNAKIKRLGAIDWGYQQTTTDALTNAVKKFVFNYNVANSTRFLFDYPIGIHTPINSTPPEESSATSVRNFTFVYKAIEAITSDATANFQHLMEAYPNEVGVFGYYTSMIGGGVRLARACIGSNYRLPNSRNNTRVTYPENKKLVQIITDETKSFYNVSLNYTGGAYSYGDALLTKITNLARRESYLEFGNYRQIWLETGYYLIEQIYTENVQRVLLDRGLSFNVYKTTANKQRTQKTVFIDSVYTVPVTVDFTQ